MRRLARIVPTATTLARLLVLMTAAGGWPLACASMGPHPPFEVFASSREEDAARATTVRTQLNAARAQAGHGPAGDYLAAEPHVAAARKRIAEGRTPEAALDYSLQNAANESDRDLHYWSFEATSLSRIHFPGALIRAKEVSVAIGVMRVQREDESPTFLLLFVAADPGLPQLGPE
jgi:hypothetical protein